MPPAWRGEFIERVAGRLSRCVRYSDADVGPCLVAFYPAGERKISKGTTHSGKLELKLRP